MVVLAGLVGLTEVVACRPPSPVTLTGTGGATSSSGGSASGGSASGGASSGGHTGSGGVTASAGSSSGGSTATGGVSSGGAVGTGGLAGASGSSVDAAIDAPDAAVDTGPTCLTAKGPGAKQTGMSFPFPQNRESSRCTYPVAYCNDDVMKAYNQWKNDTVT